MSRVAVITVMPFVLALVSCSDDLTGPSAVQGAAWRLQSMQATGSEVVRIENPDRFTATFQADGTLDVIADCNQCGGTYAVEGDTLDVRPLACTKVACATAPLDTRYVQLLGAATTLDAESDELTLRSAAGVLRFSR
jgi:heat shock protein HslJ